MIPKGRGSSILFAGLVLAGCSASDAAQTNVTIVPGMYETSVTVIDARFGGLSKEETAGITAKAVGPQVAQECLDDRPKRIGDTVFGGQCVLTRVADAGGIVDRDAECADPNGGRYRLEFRGTRAARNYDYRMVMHSRDGRDRVEMREVGRRIGDC